MAPDLTTTNVLLGIMALVSILEALAMIALLGGGFLLYRRMTRLIAGIEERHVAPVTARVNAILDDVKVVTSVVKHVTNGAEAGVRWGMARLIRQLRRRAA